MSDLLIKGMEMPQGCFFCICNKHLDPDTDMCILTRDAFDSTFRVVEHRRDNCPLVPVPPHGRLVDADEMYEEFVLEGQRSTRYKLGEVWELNGKEIRRAIYRLPTVIPATEAREAE